MFNMQLVLIAGLALTSPALASPSIACSEDPIRYKARSEELQKIVAHDQSDRKDPDRIFKDPVFRDKVFTRDLKRRKRVGEIFAEGCLKESRDFAAAALVYQHGNVPDHYFQTYIWSSRAVTLGDESQKNLMGLGVDRYLVNIGQKQLFASQANKKNTSKCWCLQQVEPSFPDERRVALGHRTLSEALDWIKVLNKNEPSCLEPKQCDDDPLKPTLPGSIPGLW
jgi:hypothetical protein